MPDQTHTNAAERLLHVLELVLTRDSYNGPAYNIWASVFGLTTQQDELVIGRFLQLRRTYEDAVAATETIQSRKRDLFTAWHKPVGSIFHPWSFMSDWKSAVIGHLKPTVMQSLAFASERLGEDHHERTVPDTELSALALDIAALRQQVIDGNLPHALRTILLRLIDQMAQAVADYYIRGVVALKEAAAVTIGTLIVNVHEIRPFKETEEVKGINKIWRRFGELVALASDSAQLSEYVGKLTKLLE